MVYYECVVAARNTANFSALTKVAKGIAHTVVENKGVVRAVHNHGIRQLTRRIRTNVADERNDSKYYNKARIFSVYFDANPATLRHLEVYLHMEPTVIKYTNVKTKSKVDLVIREQLKKNPIVNAMRRRDEWERQRQLAEDQAVESASENEDIVELMIDNMKED